MGKLIGRLFVMIGSVLDLADLMMGLFSQTTLWNISLTKILHGSILIGLIIFLIINWREDYRRPCIMIKPIIVGPRALLEILNMGTRSIFRASATIIKDSHRLNWLYTPAWERGEWEIAINEKSTENIIVASQCNIKVPLLPDTFGFVIPVMGYTGKQEWNMGVWTLGEWDNPPDDIEFELSVTADKKMRKEFSGQTFRLSQQSPTRFQFEYIGSKTRTLKLQKNGYLK